MQKLVRAAFLVLVCNVAICHAQSGIPENLRGWQDWVLRGEEFRACPFLATAGGTPGTPLDRASYRCVWPERLNLAVDARGGNFTQRWQVYAAGWVALPGSAEHWPRDVRLNGAPAAVVLAQGAPSLRLEPGSYAITGRFSWSTRPESLPLPPTTALVDLSVDGQRVAQPERPDGAVWLGKRRSVEQPAAMEVQVYRLVQDEIPVYLLTRIRLNVAGDAREELLARVLPDGFTPLGLTGGLPARLERDGRLRVQVRPGSHELMLSARGSDVAAVIERPASEGGKWARDEIWSFTANDRLRVAAAEGAEGIDPAQANVPAEWRDFPAFRMAEGAKLTVAERSRGLANADDNRLTLRRQLWLDFDHGGFTAVDQLGGTMRRDWRLDMHAPFELASATAHGEPLLVTLGAAGAAGLELRTPRVSLTTVARTDSARGAMPATGWDARFDDVSGVLHLPPGHRLLAAVGTDSASGSWFESWGLWNVFGVMLVVVFVYWTAGAIPAAIAAAALLLTYQEVPGYIWLWGNLLAALALARAAPEGRFKRLAGRYRTVSFVVLGLALLPFMWMQVRVALYPQLDPASQGGGFAYQMNQDLAPAEAYTEAADAAATAAPEAVRNIAPPIEADITAEDVGKFPDESVSEALQRIPGVGLNRAQVVQRYAAGTVLQAGPGIPEWQYNSYQFGWSGPVEATDTVRFVYIGPLTLFFWRLLGVIALAVLFIWLARLSYNWRWPDGTAPVSPDLPRASVASVLAPLLLLTAVLGTPQPSVAQGTPDGEILEELKTRLTGAPPCAPHCAEIAAARVIVEGERLEVVLQVSALASVAVAMPHASDRWQLDDVTVDARGTLAMMREGDASLWVPLSPGAHTVRLSGRLAPAESIQLAFAQPPRVIEVSSRGWSVSGINEGRLVAGSLELTRERGTERAAGDAELAAGSEFPPFVRVDRVFNLDLDWSIDTTVVRVAPRRAAISVAVPLIPGESVLTSGVEVREEKTALVGLNAGQSQISWHSGLARSESLEISLPENAARTETWNFVVNPQWHVEFAGFPAVLPPDADDDLWVFRFIPRPGEKLVVKVTRPKAASGTTLAIDAVTLRTVVGKRSSNSTLAFEYRSTQGGRHVIRLPEQARVTAVRFDNQPVQLRPEQGELPLALSPGGHRIEVDWEESRDVSLRTRAPRVNLESAASNIDNIIQMPASRWPLFASGPGVGPAVLYWGELAVFIALAWLLGRWSYSPLRFHQWLLLGLGLSTQSWFVFALVAAWLFAMRWREQWQPEPELPRWRFNVVQVALAAFTVIAISTLVFSGIRNGLLSSPDMGVTGPGSSSGTFNWFSDQTADALEPPTIYSVPMWVYRTLFFVWAGWMAFALVGWLRWAFNAWKTHDLWRGKVP